MALKLYDTATAGKRVFVPIDPKNVRMYVCGPTAYDFAHIGNARPVIVFDVLFRVLCRIYGKDHVKYVRNITDIDDKIIERAQQRGISIKQLVDETSQQFHKDVEALGCLPPSVEPYATDYIKEMKFLIDTLVGHDQAYVAGDHVFFDASASHLAYGRLSRRDWDSASGPDYVDETTGLKRDPKRDFVLWKPSKAGEPSWESPAGIKTPGRPGWHIECSAMAAHHLGTQTFDIHGGGIDLLFPHHENENAQTCCAFGLASMANFWMHNGHLQVEGQKMAKSAGNFQTINDLLHDWPGDTIRLAMLLTHYREPINWTYRRMVECHKTLNDWQGLIDGTPAGDKVDLAVEHSIYEDLNTPSAITALHANAAAFRYAPTDEARAMFRASGVLLGLFSGRETHPDVVDNAVLSYASLALRVLEEQRFTARKNRNYAEADRLRDEIVKLGYTVKDNPDGTSEITATVPDLLRAARTRVAPIVAREAAQAKESPSGEWKA